MKTKLLVAVSVAIVASTALAGDFDSDFTIKNGEIVVNENWNQPLLKPIAFRPRQATTVQPVAKVETTVNPTEVTFQPANQVAVLNVDNPEYVARRAAALQKPGAVIAHVSVE